MSRAKNRTPTVSNDADEHINQSHEIDDKGHVNNFESLRWLQDVAVKHSAAQAPPENEGTRGMRPRGVTSAASWRSQRHRV